MMFIGVMILLGLGAVSVICIGSIVLSGMISQQEREAFHREHGYWPEW